MAMKLEVGERVQLKKNHACGGTTFEIVRTGMDFRIRCETCDAQIWMSRSDLEKRIKKVLDSEGGNHENPRIR